MKFGVSDTLTSGEVRVGLQRVLWDGLATQAMVTLTSGIFLVAFALELGASNTVIGLLAAIPALAELIQIPSVLLVRKLQNRRLLTVLASFISRSFWLAIAAIPFFVPQDMALSVLILAMCGYSILSAISHCSWNSWMRDLIPVEILGAFFSNRMRLATALAMVLSLIASLFIDFWKTHYALPLTEAYSFTFIFGYVAGMLGVFFLATTPEPGMEITERVNFRSEISEPFRDLNFRNLLIFLGSWNFAVNLAAPFFTVYLLRRLGMDITWVIALAVLSQLVSVSSYRLWGNAVDRFSNKSVLRISGPLFMVSILAWTFTTLPEVHILTIPLLILIHILTGLSTAGVTLASTSIGLKLAPKGAATAYLATATFVNSLAAGTAPIIGGLFADYFAARELSMTLTWSSPGTIFAIQTLDFRQWDFFFFFAFILGLYSLHRLALVKEEGEEPEKVVVQELLSEVRREMRNLSTAGGVRMFLRFPLSSEPEQEEEGEEA